MLEPVFSYHAQKLKKRLTAFYKALTSMLGQIVA